MTDETNNPEIDDLPHPGVSDEFWAEVPDADRQAFSAYLVAQADVAAADEPEIPDAALVAEGGWCAPYDVLYPGIQVARGGIAFTAPPEPKPLTKKQLRWRVKYLEKTLRKERKGRYRAERKVERLLKIIQRIA